LDGESVTFKIKEVEVKREDKVKTILPTFEIKEEVEIMIPPFAIKLE